MNYCLFSRKRQPPIATLTAQLVTYTEVLPICTKPRTLCGAITLAAATGVARGPRRKTAHFPTADGAGGVGERSAQASAMRKAGIARPARDERKRTRSEEHPSELQSLLRISYAVCYSQQKKP